MSKNKNRRKQTSKAPKSGNRDLAVAMQELRRSSATSRHAMATDYRRKPKHVNRGWDND